VARSSLGPTTTSATVTTTTFSSRPAPDHAAV
jgi:hypothetical protein